MWSLGHSICPAGGGVGGEREREREQQSWKMQYCHARTLHDKDERGDESDIQTSQGWDVMVI